MALLCVSILAGCTAPAPPACTDCPAAPMTLAPPLLAQARWQSCDGLVGTFTLPRSAVDERVPEAFVVVDANLVSASVVFEALRCERLASQGVIVPEVAAYHAFVRVRPANESWAPDRASRYTLDLLLAGPGAAAGIAATGMPAVEATFRTEVTGSLEAWTFSSGAGTATVRFASEGGGTDVASSRQTYLWFAEGAEHRRVGVEKSYRYAGPPVQAGLVEFSGSLASAQGGALCCRAWDGQRYAESQETWTVEAERFRA